MPGDLTHDADIKVYEIKPGIGENIEEVTGIAAGPSFHFVVNNKIFFDNRIPPRGFDNEAFENIQSPPVGYSYADGQYWDNTVYSFSSSQPIERIETTLYYQTLSKEYVTFLKDNNTTNDAGDVLYSLWDANGKSAPVAMNTDVILMAAPGADFTADPDYGNAPLEVHFTDLSTNVPTSWLWDFGDESTSDEQHPTHTYIVPGEYTVNMTAVNEFGSSSTSAVINVTDLTVPVMYVQDINVTRISLKGGREAAECTITIQDNNDNPVEGATVTATYDGPTAGTETAVTDGNGVATMQTRSVKGGGGIWCFTVTDVSKSGYIYDPIQNVETTDCETAGIVSSVFNQQQDTGRDILLLGVYPNPFSTSTTLEYELDKPNIVRITFHDLSGRIVYETKAFRSAGIHQFKWEPVKLQEGIYYYRIQTGKDIISGKVLRMDNIR